MLPPRTFTVLFLAVLTLSLVSHTHAISYKRPVVGPKVIKTVRYAKIPDYKGEASRIVGMTSQGRDLYVCTSVSGGYIYKISPVPKGQPKVNLWFDVAKAMDKAKRDMDVSNGIEGGVRSIAFHPKYASNGKIYISVMEDTTKRSAPSYKFFSVLRNRKKVHSVVLEFTVKKGKPDPDSLREILRIAFPHYNHVLKQLYFQGDFLLITHGDGAPDEVKEKGGQSVKDGLGKILRINPLKPSKGLPYTIPPNNPFAKTSGAKGEIFALGFHNPHNLCTAKNGDLFVGDTGRDNVEEINIVRGVDRLRNYGWPLREGHFIHLNKGGVGDGIRQLPNKKESFVYPSAVIGRFTGRGRKFVGVSLASSCPIENGSELDNLLLYCNFPTDGQLYYSLLPQLREAKTTGLPKELTWARTFIASILYDHDGNPKTPALKMKNLRDVIRRDPKLKKQKRVDMRFGKGNDGRIYWSSKKSGWIYLITNSVPSK